MPKTAKKKPDYSDELVADIKAYRQIRSGERDELRRRRKAQRNARQAARRVRERRHRR